MADRAIGELPVAPALYDDSLIPLEQQGEARSISGALIAKFAREEGAADVRRAVDAAKRADEAKAATEDLLNQAETALTDTKAAQAAAENARDEAKAAQTAAETAKAEAESAKADAETAAASADASRTAAAASAAEAEAAARTAADDTRELLAGYVTAAEAAKDAAAASQTAGARSEANAAQSAGDARSALEAAQTAQSAAETAQALSESARADAAERAAEAARSADKAAQYSGKPPIIQEGTWWTWDAEEQSYADTGHEARGPRGLTGDKGETGTGIGSIELSEGNHAPGSFDTYTVTLTDGREIRLEIYNGMDGTGAGDMRAAVYDPQGRRTDIFAYVDAAMEELQGRLHFDELPTEGSRNPVTSAGVYEAIRRHDLDPAAHPPKRHVLEVRVRDPGKTDFGLGGGEEGVVALDTEAYSGMAEISVIVSGKEYDAKNLSSQGEAAPSGTLIIKKMED